MATASQLCDRLRAEIGDIARSFVDTFTGDGITNRFQLSQAPVQGYTLTVKVNGTDVSANVIVEEGVGVITFAPSVLPPNNAVITISGQAYRYFTDTEISYYINTAFIEHAAHSTDTAGSRITQIGLLPPIEEYPVVLLASTMALYTLANDASFDIDISSPDGVNIPRSERFRQVNEMVQVRKEQYKELCAMLNIGMYRIEVQTLRRISRLTNRYVPVYRPQEVDDGSIPQRVYLPMPDYGDNTPPTTALVRDISMYSGDDFLLDFQFSFDLTNYTPKGQVRIFTSGDYAQVGPLLLGEFTITKIYSTPTSALDTLQVTLPGSITADLPSTAYYDIQMTNNTDNTVRTYVTGKVFTRNQVTV